MCYLESLSLPRRYSRYYIIYTGNIQSCLKNCTSIKTINSILILSQFSNSNGNQLLNFYFYDSVSFHLSTSFYPSSSSPQRAFNLSPSLVSLVIQIKFFEFPFVSSVILSGWTFFPLVYSLKITFFSSSSSSRRRRDVPSD